MHIHIYLFSYLFIFKMRIFDNSDNLTVDIPMCYYRGFLSPTYFPMYFFDGENISFDTSLVIYKYI